MNLPSLRRRRQPDEQRSDTLSLEAWMSMFDAWGYGGLQQTLVGQNQEIISPEFGSVVHQAYKQNGVVFAVELARLMMFKQARFQWQNLTNGVPGDLFGTPELAPLERPWPNGTTGDLLTRMLQDADFAGNSFTARRANGRLRHMRPDWTTIVIGSRSDPETVIGDIDAEVIGYIYDQGGPSSASPSIPLLADEVAHFAPIPDPVSAFRGMSWLTPIIREVMADKATTEHKLKFFELGATPNMVISVDKDVKQEALEKFKAKFQDRHQSVDNAYRTLVLLGGMNATVVGKDLKEIDFKVTQGAGETRIAAAGGVPPVIVGLSEGLAAATYSNYGQARRRFADGTIRPLWQDAAEALQTIISPPANAGANTRLWYDDRFIPALAEDKKDQAEVMAQQSQAIATLTREGYEPKSVVSAVISGDYSRLVHTGLLSVQLHPADGSGPLALPAGPAVP